MDFLKNKRYLKWLILFALRKEWCVSHSCTTCGGQHYRRELMRLSRSELLEQLMYLPKDFLEIKAHREPILFALYEAVQINFNFLLEEFGSAPIAVFLINAIRIEKDREENIKIRIESQQHNKKLKDKSRAQKNIWGAIKRKDISAINSLLLKGLNLNQIGPNGEMLKDEIRELGVIC